MISSCRLTTVWETQRVHLAQAMQHSFKIRPSTSYQLPLGPCAANPTTAVDHISPHCLAATHHKMKLTKQQPEPPVKPVAEHPKEIYLDEKWDKLLDLSLRRTVYGFLAGGLAALVLMRGPSTRVATVAFGAGFGSGSAWQACAEDFVTKGGKS